MNNHCTFIVIDPETGLHSTMLSLKAGIPIIKASMTLIVVLLSLKIKKHKAKCHGFGWTLTVTHIHINLH